MRVLQHADIARTQKLSLVGIQRRVEIVLEQLGLGQAGTRSQDNAQLGGDHALDDIRNGYLALAGSIGEILTSHKS